MKLEFTKQEELTKQVIKELITCHYEEAMSNNKHLYMVTLHPGYKIRKITKSRVPVVADASLVLEAFVPLINSFVINNRSNSNFVKGLVITEKNNVQGEHFHLVIEQTVIDINSFEKKLLKLQEVVNHNDFSIEVRGGIYRNSKGVGYSNENSQFMHFVRVHDIQKLAGYLTKSKNLQCRILFDRKIDRDYYRLSRQGSRISKVLH